ncbi:fucolectin-4-like [Simochromis diagramma]|uniref:fucolectin-4-like n=1 Tax=Simochromis diagramma TaxID=43689 RepID=UPI001A7EA9C9|nr:fucolectin-4-like [Simochromis diagramma]
MSGTHSWSFIGISIMLTLTSGTLAGQLLYNLALKKTAVQSSTSGTVGIAGKAVDGNRDASYQRGSCTLTSEQSDPWWRVDLVNVYTIGTVMITNRDELGNMGWMVLKSGSEIQQKSVTLKVTGVLSSLTFPADKRFIFHVTL